MSLNRIWFVARVSAIQYIQHNPMIVAGTHPPINIDLGSNEPGMSLQREYRDGQLLVWRDYEVDGETVKSPVDIDALPFGVYRLKP
jgi:hypothetical protein